MIVESQTPFLLRVLRAQSELLEASLNEIPNDASKQRKAISRCLNQIFVDLVTRLNPPLVLEIGAHEGNFAKKIKSSLPGSRVVAFEAHPLIYDRYAPAMQEAGVEYLQFCIAEREGEMVLVAPKWDGREGRGMGSLLRYRSAAESTEYPVRAVTLDGFIGDPTGLPNVMWIDVEGALAQVFAGAERTLRNCQALYLEMEAVARWEGQMIDADVVSHLANYGLEPALRDVQRQHWQYNAIFVREGVLPAQPRADVDQGQGVSEVSRGRRAGNKEADGVVARAERRSRVLRRSRKAIKRGRKAIKKLKRWYPRWAPRPRFASRPESDQ
jgi:FkbM family methyltransferase